MEDLFTSLSGAKVFSKIDLSQAYQQVPLEEGSREYVVINTQKGLFRYTRLPFGVSSAPGIFQRVMESLMQGLPGVTVYIDRRGASQEAGGCPYLAGEGRTSCTEEQVPVHEVISYIPWTQSGCGRTTPSFRQSGSSCEGSHTPKSQRVQVLLGTLVLLQQIPLKPVISSCPSIPSTP